MNQSLPPALQERLDGLLASDAILDPSHPQHAATRADAEGLTSLNRLVQSDAYTNPAHVDHELVKTRVSRWFELEFGKGSTTRPVSPVVFSHDGQVAPPIRGRTMDQYGKVVEYGSKG